MVHDLAQKWIGPLLTLFGLLCATNAFMFTVVDRVEFEHLRRSKSQSQMWEIMSSGIAVVASSSVWAFVVATCSVEALNNRVFAFVTTYMVMITAIAVLKFAWLMRQILGVRAARARM